MKKYFVKFRRIVEPHGWWVGLLSGLLGIADAAVKWRVQAMFEFGWVQWGAFFIVLVLLMLKEIQTRELARALDQATRLILDAQAHSFTAFIEDISVGRADLTPEARRELQRYVDRLYAAAGKPEQADELLDAIEKIHALRQEMQNR